MDESRERLVVLIQVIYSTVEMFVAAAVAVPFLFVGYRLLRTNATEFDSTARLAGSLGNVLMGEVSGQNLSGPDPRVGKGITVETRRDADGKEYKVFFSQGKLAEETLASLISAPAVKR